MNDELISSLRICGRINSANDNCIAFHDGSCEAEPVCMYELMGKAADAIEQLTADLERSKEWEAFWEKEANEALKKYHTTVAQKPRWIPVEERLPDERQFVLAWKDEKPKGFACVSFWMDNAGWAFKNITHWMPLPPVPKEE